MEKNKTLISILNYNGSKDTIACLKSFYQYEAKENYCVVVWDNNSQETEKLILLEEILKLPVKNKVCTAEEYQHLNLTNLNLVIVLSKVNLGFAIANNEVIKNRLKDFSNIVLLNNDTEFDNATTSKLVKYLEQDSNVGVITTAIYYYYDKQRIWNAGGKIFLGTRRYYTEKYVNKALEKGITEKEVDYITGCFFVVRSSILKQCGILTEKFFFGEEDYEFCQRMKKKNVKLKVLFNEKIYHKVGATINKNILLEDSIRRAFIHHLNRFIDMKNFYGKTKWSIWCFFSCIYIYILMFKVTRGNLKKVKEYISLLNFYARKRDCVDQEFFIKTLSGGII